MRWHKTNLIDVVDCVRFVQLLANVVADLCFVAASPETHHHRAATGASSGVPVTISAQRPAILTQSNDPQLLPNGTGFGNKATQNQMAARRSSLHEPYGRSLSAHASSPQLVAHQVQAVDQLDPGPPMMPERWFVPRGRETTPRALPSHMLALPEGNAERARSGTPLHPGDTVYVADVKFVQGLPWAKVRGEHVA